MTLYSSGVNSYFAGDALTIAPISGTIVPVMGTSIGDNKIASALFGQVRRAIIALLFTHSDRSYYGREIARFAAGGAGAVHRELKSLVSAGLVTRTVRGSQVYYQANRNSPVFADLRGLIVKTSGVADVIREALAPVAGSISFAFIYGSFARSEEKSVSDMDVMVIGDAGFGDVVRALGPAQERLGREINPMVFSTSEFNQRIADGEHFVSAVMREPKVMLIGDEGELSPSMTRC